jgi:hypothetical protein
MELWGKWLTLVKQLENACSRKRTFFWLITILIGFTIRFDSLGVKVQLMRGLFFDFCVNSWETLYAAMSGGFRGMKLAEILNNTSQ